MLNFKKKQKGFTFIEIIIAVFIFSLMMLAVTGIFSGSIGGYRTARITQKNLEDAQFIMNQMAKILRTSSVQENPPTDNLIIYDYSQGKCFKYGFITDNGNKKISVGSKNPPLVEDKPNREIFEKDTAAWCKNQSFTLDPMAAFHVENTTPFSAIASKPGSGSNGVLGKVTVSLSICQNAASCSKDRVRIQSSVSLRDYYKAGI